MKRSLTLLILSTLLVTQYGVAQDIASTTPDSNAAAATAAVEAVEEEESKSPFEFSGALDVYYQYNFRNTPFPTSFTETVNGFSLGMANFILSHEGKVGFVADVAFGPRAEVANGFQGTSLSMIKQLFVTYSPTDWLKLTLGNFGTFVGYEVIDAPVNINYSTSYMFSNGPFFHTGLKADVALGEQFGFMVGILDDTDSKVDIVPGKHLGLQLSYAPSDAVGLYLNFLNGKTEDGDSLSSDVIGRQIDFVGTWQATESLGLGINATHKINDVDEGGKNTTWSGAALYANYAFSPLFTLGVRGEYIDDPDGLILDVPDNSVVALTLSGNFNIGPLRVIPEFRVDLASEQVFLDDQNTLDKALPGFLLAAVYAF